MRPSKAPAPDRIDDAKAKAIAGVVRIVPLPYGVGVVAETPWAAFDAKAALAVTWTRTGKAWGFNSEKSLVEFAAAARDTVAADQAVGQGRRRAGRLADRGHHRGGEYRNDLVYHAQMEPLNAVAAVSPIGTPASYGAACNRRPLR